MNSNSQAEVYMYKVTGGTVSIATLEAADTGSTYVIHTAIMLGSSAVTVSINGISLQLPAGFVYQYSPITRVDFNTGQVLLIGKKFKKTIFQV